MRFGRDAPAQLGRQRSVHGCVPWPPAPPDARDECVPIYKEQTRYKQRGKDY